MNEIVVELKFLEFKSLYNHGLRSPTVIIYRIEKESFFTDGYAIAVKNNTI